MNDLRQAAQRLIDRIDREGASPLDWREYDALCTALVQQAEPVAWMAHQDKMLPTFHRTFTAARDWADNPTPLYTAPSQRKPLTCLWSPEDDDTMPGTYRSACGELWSFIDGDWKDNRVRYCHGCGGKVIEASSGIQEPKP